MKTCSSQQPDLWGCRCSWIQNALIGPSELKKLCLGLLLPSMRTSPGRHYCVCMSKVCSSCPAPARNRDQELDESKLCGELHDALYWHCKKRLEKDKSTWHRALIGLPASLHRYSILYSTTIGQRCRLVVLAHRGKQAKLAKKHL